MTLLTGLVGFAAASAVGGASVNFAMLVTARACQGVFAALLAPAALSLLTTTFSDPKERGKAFGVYGAIVGSGGLIGLLLGGVLTEYLDWRWCLYVNLIFAAVAVAGALVLLTNQRAAQTPRLDYFGVVTVSGSMFCLVYGFSNAATHSWSAASTWGWLAAGVVLLVVFVAWQFRVAVPAAAAPGRAGPQPRRRLPGRAGHRGRDVRHLLVPDLLPADDPGVLAAEDRASRSCPRSSMVMVFAQISNIVLMPRIGPKLLVGVGMLLAGAGMAWLTRLGVHSSYTTAILGPLLVSGAGIGLSMPSSMNTGTFGVAPSDAGVASATLNVGQQLGGSIGTALLNTIATSAAASYLTGLHLNPAVLATARGKLFLAAAQVHGYTTAFWWTAGIFAAGGVVCGALMRWGPLSRQAAATDSVPAGQRAAGPSVPA